MLYRVLIFILLSTLLKGCVLFKPANHKKTNPVSVWEYDLNGLPGRKDLVIRNDGVNYGW